MIATRRKSSARASATKFVASKRRTKKHTAASVQPKPKKPSGWDNVKRRRAAEMEARRIAQAATAEVLKRRIIKLRSIDDSLELYEEFLNRVENGTMLPEDATKRSWVVAKAVEAIEKREVELLRKAIEQMNSGAPLSQLMRVDQQHQTIDQ